MRTALCALLTLAAAQPVIPGFEGEMPSFEEALSFVNSIQDDVSIELTDENFEHLTQAATGATTGDWFVYFYSPTCLKCQFMSPQWLFLAERIKEAQLPTNIARINLDANELTARRFRVMIFPTFLYLKGGFYYNYTGPSDADSLEAVIKDQTYLNYEKQEVPAEITWLRDWVMFIRWWVVRLRGYFYGGVAALALYFTSKFIRRRTSKREKSE